MVVEPVGSRGIEWSGHRIVEYYGRSGVYGADLGPVSDVHRDLESGSKAWKTLLERPKVTPEWVEYATQNNLNYDELRVHMEVL